MTHQFQSLKGRLLLDNGSLCGSFFERTVVLICEHNEKGAFGLTVNKAVSTTVGAALAADLNEEIKMSTLFVGGPVQTNSLSYLYSLPGWKEQSVIKGVYLGHSLEDLQDLAGREHPLFKVKIFAGYAGWSAGQLDNEIKKNSWYILNADAKHIFTPEHESLWKSIMTQQGWRYKLIADFPEEAGLN